MLDLRRRRWANIGQTLGRCVVFAGLFWTDVWLMRSTSSLGLAVSPLRGRGLMYLLYLKNSTWRWLRAISTPRSEKCPYFNVRPLSWACGHGTEMLLILKKLFSTWLFPDIFKYDSPKKCPTILNAVNLNLFQRRWRSTALNDWGEFYRYVKKFHIQSFILFKFSPLKVGHIIFV